MRAHQHDEGIRMLRLEGVSHIDIGEHAWGARIEDNQVRLEVRRQSEGAGLIHPIRTGIEELHLVAGRLRSPGHIG